jgi:hypothetical protein
MSGLRYRVFLFYNALGGLIWGIGYTLLGYIVGVSFEHIVSQVGLWSLAVVAVVVVIALAVRMILKRRERCRLAADFSADEVPTAFEPPAGPEARSAPMDTAAGAADG